MNKKMLFALIAVLAAFSLLFSACGKKDAQDAPGQADAQPGVEVLNLSGWDMTATTWSSPNGATVNLTATPAGYVDGQSAAFVIRLEGEEIDNVPCQWDGTHYTASSDLNAADGYCYYVILTGSDGATTEIAVNVPTDPIDETLINMASSLESYCSVIVENTDFSGKWLTITSGTVQVQPPRIVNEGETIECSEAVLVLSLDGEDVSKVALEMPAAEDGSYTLQLTDTAFELPALEDDQQLTMRLDVTLSNGQILTAPGGTWFYDDGSLLMAVG